MSTAVVIHPADNPDGLARVLRALAEPGSPRMRVLLAPGPGGAAPGTEAWVTALDLTHEVVWLPPARAGAVWQAAAEQTGRDDLLLLGGATEGAGWRALVDHDGQRDATVATTTALSNHAAFLSVPNRNLPWPLLPPQADLDVVTATLGGRPEDESMIPVALPHCCLVSRAALDVAGPFDVDLDAEDALAAFSARCSELGLRHTASARAFVAHHGSVGSSEPTLGAAVRQRHPWLEQAVHDAAEDRTSALACTLLHVASALRPRSVTLDARGLIGEVTGTKVHVAALARELAAREDVTLRLLVADDGLSAHARASIGPLHDVELLRAADAARAARTDVVHRPHGLDDPEELALLDALGERLVLTQHDLIGVHMPSAFPGAGSWRAHREATALGLRAASAVLVPSRHVQGDLQAAALADPRRVLVVANGTDPVGVSPRPRRPPEAPDGPFLLVLGSTLPHKQRPFAFDLVVALREQHGWDGHLVLAGAATPSGGTAGPEARRLLERPQLSSVVHDLGTVAEDEKAWLYAHATATLVPSTTEGFGLTPFEAARHGCPALVAPVASLGELVGDEQALLVAWDAEASATAVLPVLTDPARRMALTAALAARAQTLTWAATAQAVVAGYELACTLTLPAGVTATVQAAAAEAQYWRLRDALDESAHRLVGPDSPLLGRRERHLLAEVASSPRGRRLLFTFLRGVRRAT